MGVHNQSRRAAKARRRARRKERRGPSGHGPSGSSGPASGADDAGGSRTGRAGPAGSFTADPLALADLAVTGTVRRLMHGSRSAESVRGAARTLRGRAADLPAGVLATAVHDLLDRLLGSVLSCWTPDDLAELVTRRCGRRSVPALAGLLRRTAGGGGRPDARWRAELDALGAPRALDLRSDDGLGEALHLAALLALAPAGESGRPAPRGPATTAPSPDVAKRLATVRALLAKAESTPYDGEAESLTAKAQELITRYALDRLLADRSGSAGGDPAGALVVRRLWLDSPYPDAKSALVHEVADANRCRAVYAQSLSMCTLIGDPADIAAVELLVTSLLLQASRAMLRHGAQVDRYGMSRTRSFRRSFLTSFAVRIGQRLRETTQHEVDLADRNSDLLPALRSHSERVDQMLDEMFPHLENRGSAVSNAAGWAAGQVAADLASFDVNPGVTQAASAAHAAASTLW